MLFAQLQAFGQQTEKHPSAVPTRPNFSNATDTVAPGVLQVEYGFTRQHFHADASGEAVTGAYTLGVFRKLDIRWNADHALRLNAGDTSQRGSGDNWFGIRYRLNEQSRHFPSMGVLYQIKIPTSDPNKNLGSGYVDHSLAVLMSKDIGAIRLDANLVQYGVGVHDGWRSSTMGSLAVSRALRGRLGGLVEGYGGRAADGSGVASVLAAMTWRWNRRLVSDAGVEFGMTPGVPRNRFVFGVSYALARIWRHER